MSSKNLYQLCSIGLLAGGVLAGVGNIAQLFINPDQPLSALWVPVYLILLLGEMLISLSFPAIYVRHARDLGVVGLAGFLLIALSGMLLGVGDNLVSAFVDPFLASHAPTLYAGPPAPGLFFTLTIAGILFALGAVVFGIVTMRKVQSYRWPAPC